LLEKYPEVYVLLGSRDRSRGEEAVKDIQSAVSSASDRIEVIEIDTSSDESVQKAAETVASTKGGSLYGIINNAGVGFGQSVKDTMAVNYFGPRRVNDAFGKLIVRPGGRIVNVASASGPNFVNACQDATLRKKLAEPLTISGGIEELDKMASSTEDSNAYGLSKAFLNAYTVLHAKQDPDLIINSCTPGYIATDITKGMGATNPPSKGAVPPVTLLMSEDFSKLPTGRYYGSDCVRSPIDRYRDPGAPPYEGP
jgi:carbonyl reductase 1